MKKLLILVAFFWVAQVSAVEPTPCADTKEETRVQILESDYNAAVEALKVSKIALCGGTDGTNYDDATKKCVPETVYPPIKLGKEKGGVWGNFQKNCFSDLIKGSCLWYVPGAKNYRFVHGIKGKRPYQSTSEAWSSGHRGLLECSYGATAIDCKEHSIRNGDKFNCSYASRDERGPRWDSIAQDEPPEAAFCSENFTCLQDGRNYAGTSFFEDFFEWRWICRKYQGWDVPIPDRKIDRHNTDSKGHSGESIGGSEGDSGDSMEGVSYDGTKANLCSSMCSTYWALKASIISQQDAIKNVCFIPTPRCADDNEACKCVNNDMGYWYNSACICTPEQRGTTDMPSCLCAKEKGGIWRNGNCYANGSITPIEYNNNVGGNGDASVSSDNSTGTTADSTAADSTAGTSSGSDLGAGGGGSATKASISGQSWLKQLTDTLGVTTSGGGGKFAGQSGSNVSLSGLNGLTNKNGSTLGIASSNSDLFAMVTKTYTDYGNKGAFIGAEAAGLSSPNKKKPIRGTKPRVY